MPSNSHRHQSTGEEIANSVSHGLGALGVLVAAPFLLPAVLREGSGRATVGAVSFLASALLLYLSSTLYHALPRNRAKQVFERLDHAAIYLLIAGTYTPFLLGPLRGGWGWTLLGIVWVAAIVGVVLKSTWGARHKRLSTWLYVAMGWLVIVAARPLLASVPPAGLLWLLAGGVAYTAGAAFYLFDHHLRFAHFLWHLCVLIGTTCHFVAVFGYAQGAAR